MKFANASQNGRRYFGLHMVEGVAEYSNAGKDPYRILVGERTIKNMDPTFEGKPVYAYDHVDEVNLDRLQEEADGYVVRSFFNKADGKHWVEFLVVSDKGHDAIRRGFKLSNAYVPTGNYGKGGLWHGVEFEKEVLSGEYEHLAIVEHPRYAESIILTPEEFKKYNNDKEIEIRALTNSADKPKEKTEMKFEWLKRVKVENAADMEGMSIKLPKSKKEFLLSNVIEQFDAIQNMNGYANPDHMVKVGEDEMSVNDLVKKHADLCNEMAKSKEDAKENDDDMDEGADSDGMENADDEEDKDEKKKENEEAGDEKKKENEEAGDDKKKEDSKKNAADKAKGKENFKKLKNAQDEASDEHVVIDLLEDQIARGNDRYGSSKK